MEDISLDVKVKMIYGDNESNHFSKSEQGIGLNPESKLEGIKQHNFIGTYLIGPILILNPLFTQKIFKMLGEKDAHLAFEAEVMSAYNQRLKDF